MATLALRIRVSMSAMGSVMVMVAPPSPAGLLDAGQFPGVRELPEADPAEHELAEHRVGATAALAPGVGPHLELRLALVLLDQCLLGHGYCCPSRLNGKPKASSRALPSALVRAVVTIVMSIPRVESTWSYSISGKMSCSVTPKV